jgi:hypothetical protein
LIPALLCVLVLVVVVVVVVVDCWWGRDFKGDLFPQVQGFSLVQFGIEFWSSNEK